MATGASLDKRLKAIEDSLETQGSHRETYAERLAREDFFSDKAASLLDRITAERAAYEAMSVPAKIALKRQQLAERHAKWKNRQPVDSGYGYVPYHLRIQNDEGHYRSECRLLELAIGELEGTLTPEQVWVGRFQTCEMIRWRGNHDAWPVIPTHDEAHALIAKGEIDYAYQPESLKGVAFVADVAQAEDGTGDSPPVPAIPTIRHRESALTRAYPAKPVQPAVDKAAPYRDQGMYFEPNDI